MQGGGNVAEVSAGSLELSNVNLTEEFTDLIITERGFQANSRVVTTADEILVEAIGLKR
jgi:flagellar hook protein FlgE